MKNLRSLLTLVLLVAAVPAFAQFESARIATGNPMPQYPGALTLAGITRGSAVVALSIDAEGKVQDSLVLAYTQPQFARAVSEVVNLWTFVPARLDGAAVPVQTELRFDFTLEGAVITANITNHFLFDGFEHAGDNAVTYQPGRADQLDSSPVKLSGSAPKYPANAAKEGVRGKVHVRFYIDENGDVRMPAIESAGEHPYLAEQAVTAIRQWKFAPPTSKGRPVLVAAAQEFDFGGDR